MDLSRSKKSIFFNPQIAIALLAVAMIALHLILRFGLRPTHYQVSQVPLWIALLFGGVPLLWDLLFKLLHRQFGSDLLAGMSILTSIVLGE